MKHHAGLCEIMASTLLSFSCWRGQWKRGRQHLQI